VQRVLSREYASVRLPALVRVLAEIEKEGARLLKWDLAGRTLLLVLEHVEGAAVALHEKDGVRTHWRPGALVLNAEDGAHAVLTVGALVSPWGDRVLPIVLDSADLQRRRHQQATASDLATAIGKDIRTALGGAAYAEFAERFLSLRQVFVPAGGAGRTLDALRLPIPSRGFRDEVVGGLGRNTSLYWLLHRVLGAAASLEAVPRTQLEVAVGRLVAARGRTTS
jgi:hypothetical protein